MVIETMDKPNSKPKPAKPPKPHFIKNETRTEAKPDPPIVVSEDQVSVKKAPPKPKLNRENSKLDANSAIPKPPTSRSSTPRPVLSRSSTPLPPTPSQSLSLSPPPVPAARSPSLRIDPKSYLEIQQDDQQKGASSPMMSKGSMAFEWAPPSRSVSTSALEPSPELTAPIVAAGMNSIRSASGSSVPQPREAANLPVRHPPPLMRAQTFTVKEKILQSSQINHNPPSCNVSLPFDQVVSIHSVNEQCTLVCTQQSMTLIADDLEPIWVSSDYTVSCCAIDDDRLWVGMPTGLVACLDLLDGRTLFISRAAHTKPVSHIWFDDDQKAAISLSEDGKALIWREFDKPPTAFRTVPTPINSALYHKKKLYVTTRKSLYVYDPFGTTLYLTPRPIELPTESSSSTREHFSCMQTDGLTLVCGHNDGTISTFDLDSFQPIFSCKTGINAVNCITTVDGLWWLGLSSGSILVVDPRKSEMLKEWKSGSIVVKSITRVRMADKDLVVSIGAGTAFWDASLQSDQAEREQSRRREAEGNDTRDIRIFSWNVDSRNPETMAPELVRDNCTDCDLLVFGLQEVVELSNKTKTAKKMASGGDQTEHKEYGLWKRYLNTALKDRFDLVFEKALVGLYTIVFSRSTTKVNDCSLVKTGMGGLHGNKGGISISLSYEGTTISLINCHLAAGHTQIIQRNRDAAQILDTTVGGLKPLEHDYCFFFGDTNYRINTARELAVKYIQDGNFERLASLDQLNGQKRKNPTFVLNALHEHELLFAPTYKFDRNSDRYDSSDKKRVPAWCDRILYRGNIQPKDYSSISCQYSDHRPVTGLFTIQTLN